MGRGSKGSANFCHTPASRHEAVGYTGRYQGTHPSNWLSVCEADGVWMMPADPDGTRTRESLPGRYLALSGVAARTDRGAKGVQLSTRQMPRMFVCHRSYRMTSTAARPRSRFVVRGSAGIDPWPLLHSVSNERRVGPRHSTSAEASQPDRSPSWRGQSGLSRPLAYQSRCEP